MSVTSPVKKNKNKKTQCAPNSEGISRKKIPGEVGPGNRME